MFKFMVSVFMLSFSIAACPDGYYEDDCGNCWMPYCYNYVTHETSFDTTEAECVGTAMWVIPGDDGDPYFNSYCDSCPDGFYADDCGHCWMPYCYTLFADPPHTVYFDLTETSCLEAGYGWYLPGSTGDPYYNSNCDGCPDGEIVDDCGVCQASEDSVYWNMTCQDCAGIANGGSLIDECDECQSPYCYDFVTHEVSFTLPCSGATVIEVAPDSDSNPYWNSSCDPDACPDGQEEDCAGVCGGYAMVDDCGLCSDNYYCYDYVTHQTNTDFPCDGPTEMLVMPDSSYNDDWNASCLDCAGTPNGTSMVDDCEVCQDAYCYDYVSHVVNYDFPCDGPTEMFVSPDNPSNPYWNSSCDPNACNSGDITQDGILNILDVVAMIDHILNADATVLECGDINGDGIMNVLDVVSVVDTIINGRMSDASFASFTKYANGMRMRADGFVGGVQMTIIHDEDFSIELSDEALVSKYKTKGNSTTLIVAAPESDNLFTSFGEFQIVDVVVANSKDEIDYDINDLTELVSDLGSAYPNPFNPVTSFELNVVNSDYVSVKIYNMMGQLVETLVDGSMSPNIYTISWDASDVPSGMYIARFQSSMSISSQKLLLVK